MTQHERLRLGAEGSRVWVNGLGHFGDRVAAARLLYDALRDWLVRERLVDAGLMPAGPLQFIPEGTTTLIAARGVPIGRTMPGALELFLPPYVRGQSAEQAALELATVLHGSGWAENPIIEPGGGDEKQSAA